MIRNTVRLLFAVLFAAAPITSAFGQGKIDPKDVDRFLDFLRSKTYSELLGQKAIENDEALPPPCKQARELVGRKLYLILKPPTFIASRDVPVDGEWAERVEIKRCGKITHQNVFFFAGRQVGLRAVVGLPGTTITEVKTQHAAGLAMLTADKQRNPTCRTLEISNTELTARPLQAGASWTERWTVYACGKSITHTVEFTPDSQGVVSHAIDPPR
ncbi:MAG: hypothetical protein AB7G15_03435 [Alphaproteobacteria bacterium]